VLGIKTQFESSSSFRTLDGSESMVEQPSVSAPPSDFNARPNAP